MAFSGSNRMPQARRTIAYGRKTSIPCPHGGGALLPPVLKAYLDNFRREVQRYFPLPAGSPREAFEKLAGDYPAFELVA